MNAMRESDGAVFGVAGFLAYRCVVPYPAASDAELTLRHGDLVFVAETRHDGWCRGWLQRTGRDGLFPATFVEPAQ